MSDKKLTVLPGGAMKNNALEAIRQFSESLPILIEHSQLMAKLHKAKFDALKAEGFNDAQALELCKVVL